MLTHVSMERSGMIGHLFNLKKIINKVILLKITTLCEYWDIYISIDGRQEAAIQCSSKALNWITFEKQFIVQIKLSINFNVSFVTVPIEALVHPLCVFPDINKDCTVTLFMLCYPKEIGAATLETE